MQVEVKLYATLRRYRPQAAGGASHHPFYVIVSDEATLATLVERLGIPAGLVNAAAVNGEAVPLETPLHESDQVSFFPPAAGGRC